MATALDSDRALEDEAQDQFGFVGMAKRLAPSIVEASKGDGMVIGLEGRDSNHWTTHAYFFEDSGVLKISLRKS